MTTKRGMFWQVHLAMLSPDGKMRLLCTKRVRENVMVTYSPEEVTCKKCLEKIGVEE